MSTELQTHAEQWLRDQDVLVREFEAEITPGDGRTVDVRIVPYFERIKHDDGHGGLPPGELYTEEFVPGAFAGQEKAANRVLMNVEHERGIGGVVGHGIALREDADGFYGSFKLHDTPEGNKALMLVNEKILDTVSIEARPIKSVRTADGVVQRVKVHLRNVALTRFAAYSGAQVLAVREEAKIIDEELLPVDMDRGVIERLLRQGISIPDRYKTHPAVDTPSEDGTSEPAPVETDNAKTEESEA